MRIRPGMSIPEEVKKNQNKQTSAAGIKFIEQTGAKVVPIFQDAPDANLQARLKLVNGVIIPGHDDQIFDRENNQVWDQAATTIYKIMDYSRKLQEDTGKKFPIFGICQGMHALVGYECWRNNVDHRQCLDQLLTYMQNLPLIPSDYTYYNYSKTIFRDLPWDEFNRIKDEKVFQHYHTYSISKESADNKAYLKDNFNVLAYSDGKIRNKDYKEVKIVSALQHKKQPWQGIQFHPEKSEFEISIKLYPNLVNSRSIAKVGQAMANAFVEECRTDNPAHPDDKQWVDLLIYNNKLIFSKILYQSLQVFNDADWNRGISA